MPCNCQTEITHLRELIDQRSQLTQLAIDKAEQAVNKRLLSMNEFRAQQADIIARFATNERLDSVIRATETRSINIDKELDDQKQWKSNMQGKQAVIQILWPIVVGIVVFILSHYYK